jgi:hypothetical protein
MIVIPGRGDQAVERGRRMGNEAHLPVQMGKSEQCREVRIFHNYELIDQEHAVLIQSTEQHFGERWETKKKKN